MTDAYAKKVRFVDALIDEWLIPDECRDAYGIDAVALVRHLAEELVRQKDFVALLKMEKQKLERLVLGVPSESDG